MKKKDGKQKAPEGKYMSSVKVGPKGQIVIPKEAREMFGIEPGDTLLLLADVKQGIAIHRMDFFTRMAEAIFRRGRGDSDYSEGEKSFDEAVMREAEEKDERD